MRKIGWLKFSLAVLLLGGVFGSYVALSGQGNNPVIAENVLTFAVADVNGDSYPDIIAGVTDSPQTHNLKLFLNHNGVFSEASSLLSIIPPAPDSPVAVPYIIKLADINNDALPDIIVLGQKKHSASNLLFLGAGNGVFQLADEKIIAQSFFNTPAIDVAVQDINDDAKPEIILLNPEKLVVFAQKDGCFTVATDLVPPAITPEKPITSLEINIDNNPAVEVLKIENKQLVIAESQPEPKVKSGSSSLKSLQISSLAATHTTPWKYAVTTFDGTGTLEVQDTNHVVYLKFDATDPNYVYGNALAMYPSDKITAVSMEEGYDWPAFWSWWTTAVVMAQHGGSGLGYYYDGLFDEFGNKVPGSGSGSDLALQWVGEYGGDGNAGPVCGIDPLWGSKLSLADREALAARMQADGLSVTAEDIRKYGAIFMYVSTYAGGLYNATPLSFGIKVNMTQSDQVSFCCLANDWTSYNWFPQNLDSIKTTTITINLAQLPKITSITPAKIYPGRQITITGSDFAAGCQVKFTIASVNTTVTPDSVSADGATLIVTAPTNIGSGNAAVTVLQDNLESNASTVYIYPKGLPGIIEVLTDMIADPTITDTTYLAQAKTNCEAMVANLSAMPPNYTAFLTNMSTAMNNIARAANALFPTRDVWYLANELVYVRTAVLNAGSAHDHTVNLLQGPALLIIAKMKTTPLGLGFNNLSWALQETNEAAEEYIFLDFQQYFIKLKSVDAYLSTATANGVDAVAVSLIRSALATIGYNFFLAIYNQGVAALTGQGHTASEINTQEWLSGLKTDIDAMDPEAEGMTYPAFWDAAKQTYTRRIGNSVPTVSRGSSPVPVKCGCFIRMMYVKGGPIIDGDVVKNDSVTSCGLKMALELVKKDQDQNGQPINTEIRDIDEWEIVCFAVNGLCGKVDKQDVSDYISAIQWTLTADTPDGVEEGVTDTTGRLESESGKATVYYPPELKVGFATQFKVTLKVTATDTRQHSKSDKLEISYTISVKRTDTDVYETFLTQKGDKNERNPDPVTLKPGCGCQTQLKEWKVGETLAFDSPAGNQVEYIGVGSPAIIVADSASDEDRLKVDCAGLEVGCPVHTTEDPIDDTTYCTWSLVSGQGSFPISTQGKETTFVASAAGDVSLKATVTDSKGQWLDTPDVTRTLDKVAVKVDLNINGVADDKEEKEGGYVIKNDNDDDENGTLDINENQPVSGENDIIDLTLSVQPTTGEGDVILERKGGNKIRVWKPTSANNWQEINFNGTDNKWLPNQVPATLKVEGKLESSKERDIELQLKYCKRGTDKLITCDKVKLTVVDVNLNISTADSDKKVSKGGFVPLNNDHDNGNLTIEDRNITGPINAEDDLKELSISYAPVIDGWTLKLDAPTNKAKIKIWTSSIKGTQVPLEKSWVIGTDVIPTTLYIEGVAASGVRPDIGLKLSYVSTKNKIFDDEIKATVVKADLTIGAIDEQFEETVGDTVAVGGLTKLSFALLPANMDVDTLTLAVTAGGAKIKIYEGADKKKLVATPVDVWNDKGWVYTELWVEGIETSDPKEVKLKLTYSGHNITHIDRVCLTIVSISVNLTINRLDDDKENWGTSENWVALTEEEENGLSHARDYIGGLVGLNGDDDNHNYITDKDEKIRSTDENDLVPIDVNVTSASTPSLKLKFTSGSGVVRIWDGNTAVLGRIIKADDTVEVVEEYTFTGNNKRFWVEGVAFSGVKNGIILSLETTVNQTVFSDFITITVIGVEAKADLTDNKPTTQFIGLISASGRPANQSAIDYVSAHPRVYGHVYTAGMDLPGVDSDVDVEIYSYNTTWQVTNQGANNVIAQELYDGPINDDKELEPDLVNSGHYWNELNDSGIWAVDDQSIDCKETNDDNNNDKDTESISVVSQAGGEIVVRLWEDLPRWTGIRPPGWMMVVIKADLDMDANRDGTVVDTSDDDTDENKWEYGVSKKGAIIICNNDNDDIGAGNAEIDNENETVDGDDDVADLTTLTIRKLNMSTLPQGIKVILKVSDKSKVRLFDERDATATAILGPNSTSDEYEIPDAVSDDLEYGIEATQYPDKDFDGLLTISLIIRDNNGNEINKDEVQVRVAPWLMPPNTATAEKVYVSDHDDTDSDPDTKFVEDIRNAIGNSILQPITCRQSNPDVWVQDEFEIGYFRRPNWLMHVVLDSARNGRGTTDRNLAYYPRNNLLGQNFGIIGEDTARWSTDLDSFGNLEVSPPVTAEGKEYKLGRIIYGSNTIEINETLRKFLEAQKVQAPFKVDTTWLYVGHIDEIISFVPNPMTIDENDFVILLASPQLAIDILESQPDRAVLIPMTGESIDTALNQWKNYNVQKQNLITNILEPKIKANLGNPTIIKVPVYFKNRTASDLSAVALIPNMVNLLAANGKLMVAKPFFDPFKNEFISKLSNIGYNNSTIYFIDDWFTYHVWYGDVHCGTAVKRTPPDIKWWEQEP